MAGVHVEITTDEITQALNAMLDFGANTYEFLNEIGGRLVSSTQDRFDSSTAPDGSQWIPSQRAIKQGGKTLKESGALVGSITHESHDDYVEVGSNLAYAAIHQLGGKAGRNHSVNLPARPYLGLSPEDEQMIIATGYEFIEAATR